MKSESFTYLLKLNEESNLIFENFNEKLGWNKKDTILKLLHIFNGILNDLDKNKILSIQVKDEKTLKVLKEKTASFDLLRNPS